MIPMAEWNAEKSGKCNLISFVHKSLIIRPCFHFRLFDFMNHHSLKCLSHSVQTGGPKDECELNLLTLHLSSPAGFYFILLNEMFLQVLDGWMVVHHPLRSYWHRFGEPNCSSVMY